MCGAYAAFKWIKSVNMTILTHRNVMELFLHYRSDSKKKYTEHFLT